ncbi:hypothetical protein BU16DRAFT_46482 [Lophium mytilinum]|uniref:Uncharacterized protein n=1 Tax=Lophium mytilinum TaxID=390894 RepID=A0A6A6QRE4_9PEZI|nr:hypothetical protein BU16DRAFT_46482 [Lophium mytilinum]
MGGASFNQAMLYALMGGAWLDQPQQAHFSMAGWSSSNLCLRNVTGCSHQTLTCKSIMCGSGYIGCGNVPCVKRGPRR